MNKSKLFIINLKDIIRGFIIAVLTAVLSSLMPILESGAIPKMTDFKSYLFIGLAAGIAYILKNWLTNSNDQILKPEK